jgi:uncharacterized protein
VRVQGLWRCPVKSMQGEACDEVELSDVGVVGDRSFGVLDLASHTIMSAKRDGRLLQAGARFSGAELLVGLPGREELARGPVLDNGLSEWLGRPVRLVEAAGYGTPTFEAVDNFEREDSGLHSWEGEIGSFVDESPLHLVTTADLSQLAHERPELQWEVLRFRPNLLIEAPPGAFALAAPRVRGQRLSGQRVSGQRVRGQRVIVGDVELEVLTNCLRCVMTTRAQPGGIERQLDILRHVTAVHDNAVGVRASVVRAGVVRLGGTVRLAPLPVPAGE